MGRGGPVPERARQLGHDVRALRLARNIAQAELAAQAGVSLRSLKNLERGTATLRTLVLVLHILDRDEWLAMAARGIPPGFATNFARVVTPRQRAAGAHLHREREGP